MDQREYVRRLLEAYRATPGTCGAVRRPEVAGQQPEEDSEDPFACSRALGHRRSFTPS